jgi:hypothetical protein
MAKEMMDIGLSADEDLYLVGGDFPVEESTAQHQRQLLLNNKGDYKENPTICAGAFTYLNDEYYQGLIRAVNIEFSRDGMDVADVQLRADGIIESNSVYS